LDAAVRAWEAELRGVSSVAEPAPLPEEGEEAPPSGQNAEDKPFERPSSEAEPGEDGQPEEMPSDPLALGPGGAIAPIGEGDGDNLAGLGFSELDSLLQGLEDFLRHAEELSRDVLESMPWLLGCLLQIGIAASLARKGTDRGAGQRIKTLRFVMIDGNTLPDGLLWPEGPNPREPR
jgi:hypothetical protein